MLNHPNQKSEKEGGIVSIHRVRERQGSECEWERQGESETEGGRLREREGDRERGEREVIYMGSGIRENITQGWPSNQPFCDKFSIK